LIKNIILLIIKEVIILKNERKKFSFELFLFRIFSIAIIAICLYSLYLWNEENNANLDLANSLLDKSIVSVTKTTDNTQDETTISGPSYEILDVNFEELSAQNEQTVGWVKLNNTNISFPIVQAQDNKYYLTHNFNKKYNSAGWIFADSSNNLETLDKNTIVYGHNRRNGTMFSNLRQLLNPEWFNEETNRYFNFNTKSHKYIAQIFSVYKISKNKLVLNNKYDTEEIFNEFIQDSKSKSVYDFNIDINYFDNVLTLCTCDNNTQYRVVVFAKLITIE